MSLAVSVPQLVEQYAERMRSRHYVRDVDREFCNLVEDAEEEIADPELLAARVRDIVNARRQVMRERWASRLD